MSISVVLASAFVLSFVALLVFIWSQRHGLFGRDSSGARVIFGADEIGRAEEPAVTQPRAYVPGNIMPSYPYLFLIKDQAEPDDVVVQLPDGGAPGGKVVVASPEAQELVSYLLSLNRTHPVREQER